MAIKFAISSSLWSNTATWDNGALPQPDDNVYANGYSVTMDTGSTVNSINNTASPVSVVGIATPVMTSTTTPSGVASASSNNANGEAWRAFDQNTSGASIWSCNTNNTGWLRYQFPTGKIIKRYAVFSYSSAGNNIRSWTFEGSNDGTNWTVLDTQTLLTLSLSSWWIGPLLANTTSYTYYRINITATGGANPAIGELDMTESDSVAIGGTNGGTFTLNGGVSITTSNGVYGGNASGVPTILYSANSPASSSINSNIIAGVTTNANALNFTGTGTLTINGNVSVPGIVGGTTDLGILFTGNGVLNINGNLVGINQNTNGNTTSPLHINSSGTVNIVGSITGGTFNSTNINVNTGMRIIGGSPTINISGSIIGGSDTAANGTSTAIQIDTGGGVLNITGSITSGQAKGWGITCAGTPTINVLGNLNSSVSSAISLTGAATVNVNGNVTPGTSVPAIATTVASTINISGSISANSSSPAINSTVASIVSVIGNVIASSTQPAISLTSQTSQLTVNGNLFNSGSMMAVYAPRVFMTPTGDSWRFFLSDNATQRVMVSADQITVTGSFPNASDVRSGVTYAISQSGTCIIPSASFVAAGVPVDKTVGTAVLPAISIQDVWNYPISSISGSGSIGARLKEVATVSTVGSQIAGFGI